MFLDPLAGAVTKTHQTLETEKEEKPFDAPLSITKREQLERQVPQRTLTDRNTFFVVMQKILLMTFFLSDRQQSLTSMCQTWARCPR